MKTMLNMGDRTGSDAEKQQRDLRPGEISRSEEQVKRKFEASQSFVNPFHFDNSEGNRSRVCSAQYHLAIAHSLD